MTQTEMDNIKNNVIPNYLDSKIRKNGWNLFWMLVLIGVPLFLQFFFLSGDSMIDYTEIHPETTSVVYAIGFVCVVGFMLCFFLFMPIYFSNKSRNSFINSSKIQLLEKLKKWNDYSHEEFVNKVIEESNFIHSNI